MGLKGVITIELGWMDGGMDEQRRKEGVLLEGLSIKRLISTIQTKEVFFV